ncbi:hypothetical protein HB364_06475 [Pseudoflavitalea sp. X16]|uniref:hypothetical protein n=1 Tax=Paraflavitalea devenefica TaxID=2716334 RepID=UPI0014202D59|nr:hypothetical protein [Paraflavitalea devenefica]NII24713.1 hypothetical protein [Paraflavitalea devenefica]
MKQSRALLFLCVCFFVSHFSYSQTVQYPEFPVSIYRYAQDQRYSDHKSIVYVADVDESLLTTLFPVKPKKNTFNKGKEGEANIDSFRMSIGQELSRAGVEAQWGKEPDLAIVIIVNSFSASLINAGSFGTNTYSLSGKAKLAVMNSKKEPYLIKEVNISEQIQQDVNKLIKNSFTEELANQKAAENYSLMFQVIKRMAIRAEDTYMNSFKNRTVTLPSVYRAAKKYPELVFFDSLNSRLVADLNKKAVTDYKQFIVPYETEITTFINKEFPKGYDAKDIKVAGNSTLAFLYYLAYDTVKLKQSLDFLYENGTKFLGNRLEYTDRKPYQVEAAAYYSSLSAPKIRPDSTSGDVKAIFGGTEKSNEGWLVLEKGDTLKGKHIAQQMNGTIIDLDGSNKVLFEYTNEKGKTVRKSFKYGEVKTLCFNQRVFESHKFKPNMAQAGALSMDLLRARDYMLEVIYNSAKIKVYKDTYGNEPTNAVLFARPGEAELANQGKDWNKKKPEMMKEYFKDCPAVLTNLEKAGYDFNNEKGYVQMANDYATCK